VSAASCDADLECDLASTAGIELLLVQGYVWRVSRNMLYSTTTWLNCCTVHTPQRRYARIDDVCGLGHNVEPTGFHDDLLTVAVASSNMHAQLASKHGMLLQRFNRARKYNLKSPTSSAQ
jgi:hypothetical protein